MDARDARQTQARIQKAERHGVYDHLKQEFQGTFGVEWVLSEGYRDLRPPFFWSEDTSEALLLRKVLKAEECTSECSATGKQQVNSISVEPEEPNSRSIP